MDDDFTPPPEVTASTLKAIADARALCVDFNGKGMDDGEQPRDGLTVIQVRVLAALAESHVRRRMREAPGSAPTPAPIIIYRRSRTGLFHVHQGERYADMLCWDEMLGQIATLTHSEITSPRFEMLTPEGWAERRDRSAARIAARKLEEGEL